MRDGLSFLPIGIGLLIIGLFGIGLAACGGSENTAPAATESSSTTSTTSTSSTMTEPSSTTTEFSPTEPSSTTTEPIAPRVNEDHWHAGYAVWDCATNRGFGGFYLSFSSTNDPLGIHSHGDGVIHIHPWDESASGENATMSHFFEAVGVQVTPEAIVMPSGKILASGAECAGKPSIITVRRWRDINSLERDPIVYTENFGDIRFWATGEVFIIARAPVGVDLVPPPGVLENTYNSTEGLIERPVNIEV